MSGALEARLSLDVGHGGRRFHLAAALTLKSGVLVLFGPSGVGKSLTLAALAGLIPVASGYIRVQGDVVLDTASGVRTPTHLRRIGYVPQTQALFPFADVTGNVAFGLPRAAPKGVSEERVAALLEELGIAHLAAARPGSLSVGERQRVALARALAVTPKLLLLDEPFASIDAAGALTLRRTVRQLIDRHDVPTVLVTHDPAEALAMGDEMVRFERGTTIEQGAPHDVLARAGVNWAQSPG